MTPGQLTAKAGLTRPRIADEREAEILDAAVRVLAKVGYDRLTMDQVAAEARASKASLYRHWSSKAELVVDAISKAKGMPETPPDTGSLRGDLMATWCGKYTNHSTLPVSVMNGLMSAMHADEELATAFRERLVGPRMAAWRVLTERLRGPAFFLLKPDSSSRNASTGIDRRRCSVVNIVCRSAIIALPRPTSMAALEKVRR